MAPMKNMMIANDLFQSYKVSQLYSVIIYQNQKTPAEYIDELDYYKAEIQLLKN